MNFASSNRGAVKALETMNSKLEREDLVAVVGMLMKIVANVINKPNEQRVRSLRYENKQFQSKVAQKPGAIDFLKSIGFTDIGKGDDTTLALATEDTSVLMDGFHLLEKQAKQLRIDAAKIPKVFDPFSSTVVRVVPQPRGKSSTDAMVDSLKSKRSRILAKAGVPHRRMRIAPPGVKIPVEKQSSGTSKGSNASDSGIVLQAAKMRQQKQKDAENFKTRSMRELEQLKQKLVFTETLLRVQFPDRTTLHAYFSPGESIAQVKQVLKEALAPEMGETAIVLFTTPPRKVLEDRLTLEDLKLVPAASVFLSWDGAATSGNFQYLRPEYAARLADKQVVSVKSNDSAEGPVTYPAAIPLVKPKPTSEKDSAMEVEVPASKPKATKKLPKWFKR